MALWAFTGCDVAEIADPNAWTSSQKTEFLEILENDKYASICNQQALYAQTKESQSSKQLLQLLVAYSKNLANGCLNVRHSNDYAVYKQIVNPQNIALQIKAGQNIESILKPYVPRYRQFSALITYYKTLDAKTALAIKVRKNIERIKVMKTDIGTNYALINIPEFMVRIIESDKEAVKMAVVVGKKHQATPVFASELKYITLNPQWSVPDSIARNEIIPKLLRNPNYLTARRMVVRKSYNLASPKIAVSSVDWKKYKGGKGYVPYKFIEVPSRRNGLGRVKFIFPNKHSVYMHDTQSKGLFKRKVRTFSHGCVRLHKPKTMLNYIATHYTVHSQKTVKNWYDKMKTKHLNLNKKLTVHTSYLTTYIDDAGLLINTSDIYGFDKKQKLNFN